MREALEALTPRRSTLPEGSISGRVVVEPPRDPSHGDLATNAALVLAKEAKTNPKALGEALAAELRNDPRVAEASLAGPGFINLRLKPEVFLDVVRSVLAQPAQFGRRSCRAAWSTSSTSPPTRPARCMSATAAARCSATPWRACSPRPGGR